MHGLTGSSFQDTQAASLKTQLGYQSAPVVNRVALIGVDLRRVSEGVYTGVIDETQRRFSAPTWQTDELPLR